MDMAAFEGEFDNDYVIGSQSEIMHLFWGIQQSISFLDAKGVQDELREEFPWFSMLAADPQGFWSAQNLSDDVEAAKFFDKMAEWVKSAGSRMTAHVVEHGIPEAHLAVFMPCHRGWAHLSFNVDKGKPELFVPGSDGEPDTE